MDSTMTADEVAAWESMARDGSLGRYVGRFAPATAEDYQQALRRRVERLGKNRREG